MGPIFFVRRLGFGAEVLVVPLNEEHQVRPGLEDSAVTRIIDEAISPAEGFVERFHAPEELIPDVRRLLRDQFDTS